MFSENHMCDAYMASCYKGKPTGDNARRAAKLVRREYGGKPWFIRCRVRNFKRLSNDGSDDYRIVMHVTNNNPRADEGELPLNFGHMPIYMFEVPICIAWVSKNGRPWLWMAKPAA